MNGILFRSFGIPFQILKNVLKHIINARTFIWPGVFRRHSSNPELTHKRVKDVDLVVENFKFLSIYGQ